MKPVDRNEYVKNRIETAYKTLEAAKVLSENGFWNSAVNRLYYSIFYAVNAILVRNEIIAQSHSGVKSQFSLHFIKTGKFDKKYGKLLAELYDWRQKGDYESLYEFDSESVLPLFNEVLEMIQVIEKELKNVL
ncbi:MAG TPA: HEPN domain-containing protein [Bacteroidales bacterium]|nr:HEPN domain-containing protein [Bacteroidales bacterium]